MIIGINYKMTHIAQTTMGENVYGESNDITDEEYRRLVDPTYVANKILTALEREWEREAILAYTERFK